MRNFEINPEPDEPSPRHIILFLEDPL